MAASNLPPVIIKRGKGNGHDAPHSTAWKVALADFMTSMFIIFFLLWLLKVVTPEQKQGIANYFSPASARSSGSNGFFGGENISTPGMQKSDSAPIGPPGGGPTTPQDGEGASTIAGYAGNAPPQVTSDVKASARDYARERGRNRAQLRKVEQEIRQALQQVPKLEGFAGNVALAQAPEGLRIQLVDNEKRELFKSGSAVPLPAARELMTQVAKVIANVPNRVAISGHTDGQQLARSGYSNWELSADRANASRKLLESAGIPEARIAEVTGKADRDPLVPDDPNSPFNRRISIVLLNDEARTTAAAAAADDREPPLPPGPAPEGPLIPR